MTEVQAKELLKVPILKNGELESAAHSSTDADRLRIENDRLREVIEKKEPEIGVKDYPIKTKYAELQEKEPDSRTTN